MLHIIKRCQTAWTIKWRKPLKSWANFLLSAFALRQAASALRETIVPEINSICKRFMKMLVFPIRANIWRVLKRIRKNKSLSDSDL